MKIGLVGLPGSGKTTCFRVLSGQSVVDSHHEANLATVSIPDERLDAIYEAEQPDRRKYAQITFYDFAALQKGQAERGELELHKVAEDVDALAAVIQCFGELNYQGEPLDPEEDLETLLLEMGLSDLRILKRTLENIQEGPRVDRDPQVIELLEQCIEHLGSGGCIRELGLSEPQLKNLRGYAPLTLLPLLVVCNVAEDDLEGERAAELKEAAEERGLPHIDICAELEEEIAELSEDDQREFLEDYGLDASARDRFLRSCFDILDLVSFFTVNENEARAWTVERGSTAPQAAGKVHSDMQDGFIRAEVTSFEDFDNAGSLQACKRENLQRLEGKDYVVKEGDILQIRFSR